MHMHEIAKCSDMSSSCSCRERDGRCGHAIRGAPQAKCLVGMCGGAVAGTEVDPGNASAVDGLIASSLYLALVWCGVTAAYRISRDLRTVAAVGALGILVVTFVRWFDGGQYMIVALLWLVLGWIDSEQTRAVAPVASDANSVVV